MASLLHEEYVESRFPSPGSVSVIKSGTGSNKRGKHEQVSFSGDRVQELKEMRPRGRRYALSVHPEVFEVDERRER